MAQRPASHQNASSSATNNHSWSTHTVEYTVDDFAQILRTIPKTSDFAALNQAVDTALQILTNAQGGGQSFTALATDACKLVSIITLKYQEKSPCMNEGILAELLRQLSRIAQFTKEKNTNCMTVQDLGQIEFYRGQLDELWIDFERRFEISTHDIQGVLKDVNSSEEKDDGINNACTLYDGMNIPKISGGVHTVVAGTEYTYHTPAVPTSFPNAPADHNPAGDTALFCNGTIGEISNGTFTAVGRHRIIMRIG